MSGDLRPALDSLVTPAHVWAGLSGDRRTQVIAALAHLAVQWLTAQPVPHSMPCWKETHNDPYLDPPQNSACAS